MYNPMGRNEQRKMQDKQEPSQVLLVCIYDTIALEVTNQLVYERFSKYGPIIKVLIFEKGEVTKLFVEFTEQSSAQQVDHFRLRPRQPSTEPNSWEPSAR
jgi:hypothetical protein